MSTPSSLVDRHTDATQRLILASALALLERGRFQDLTVRAVAKEAGMSERTVFRYYATREQFLDAVAAEVADAIRPPAVPDDVAALAGYARSLYAAFEARATLVRAALHTDLYPRVRERAAQGRWRAVRALVDAHAPHRSARERRLAGANLYYYLSATTWHYYRFHFEFSLDDAVECAEAAVRQTLDALGRKR